MSNVIGTSTEGNVNVKANPVTGALLVEGVAGGLGSSDTTEATQLLVKTAVESINTKINATVTPVNISGTITTGGTAQVLSAAKPLGRRGFEIYNPDITYSLFFSITTTAVAASPSQEISPGKMYQSPDSLVTIGAISIISAQTGHKFTATEW